MIVKIIALHRKYLNLKPIKIYKMKYSKTHLFITSLLISNFAIAQLDQSRSSIVSTGNNIHLPVDYLRNNLLGNNGVPENIVGSQYFDEEFKPSKVIINDTISYNAMLRYNAYVDEIEIEKDDKISGLFKREYLSAIIDGQEFSIKEYETNNTNKKGYFIKLVPGETALYKKTTKKYNPAKPAKSTYTKDIPPSFSDETSYYILSTNNAKLTAIKLKQKSILELLTRDAELKQFIKENNLDLKKELDLIRLFKYYNN